MSFEVAAAAYDRYMGRFSQPLAVRFLAWAGSGDGPPVLDIGCGPGALTGRLVEAVGADRVSAVDPSESFLHALADRLPGVDARVSAAEHLPFDDGSFGAAYAQLVVHFMADPVAGLAEMSRVVRPGGTVAACVWDFGDGSPLGPFWDVARELDPSVPHELARPGTRPGQLMRLARQAGLTGVVDGVIEVAVPMATFEAWWEPFTLGVGPAGDYVASLSPAARERLREACRRRLPDPPFEAVARAWAVRARV
ncbi:class I SAM-dependent methyltransferase [Nocardioides sp. AN3]